MLCHLMMIARNVFSVLVNAKIFSSLLFCSARFGLMRLRGFIWFTRLQLVMNFQICPHVWMIMLAFADPFESVERLEQVRHGIGFH